MGTDERGRVVNKNAGISGDLTAILPRILANWALMAEALEGCKWDKWLVVSD